MDDTDAREWIKSLAPNGSNKTGFIPPITEMRNIIKEVSSAMTELCLMAYNNKTIHTHV